MIKIISPLSLKKGRNLGKQDFKQFLGAEQKVTKEQENNQKDNSGLTDYV
jgi:hypothetical protein